jgi:hypothetical protein
MTHKNDRVLSVAELAWVEGEGALYIRASGRSPTCAPSCKPGSTSTTPS